MFSEGGVKMEKSRELLQKVNNEVELSEVTGGAGWWYGASQVWGAIVSASGLSSSLGTGMWGSSSYKPSGGHGCTGR